MRLRPAVLLVSALSFLGLPCGAHAQFQEPTKEELQMTSDPKAPGADAVYLYREETTDDALHYHSYYARIKVLTEKGKELATVRIPYEHGNFKVTDIHGRTIHSDGTVTPLAAKPTDLLDVKTKDYQVNSMVFTLPSAEVGSILEYRLILRYDDTMVSSPFWDVQQPYFVHKAHYFFKPTHGGVVNKRGDYMSRLMYEVHAGKDDKVNQDMQGRYTFDVMDVPAIPHEDWMPPLNSMNWKVNFYYTQYTSGTEFWKNEGKRWLKEANHFAEPTSVLKQAVAQIVSPSDSEDQKARKIYDAVMKLDNTSFTRSKDKAERKSQGLKPIRNAEDAWNQKAGSSDDLALLYVALARAAGLKVWPMQVVNRDHAIFEPDYLTLDQLDDYVVAIELNGKTEVLDPGQKMCPFGLVHWKHTLASGLKDSDKGPVFGTTPSLTYMQAIEERLADLSMDPTGKLTGSIRFVLTGQEALYWRQLTLSNDADEVKKRFNESIRETVPDGVQVDFDHFLALDDYNANLIAVIHVSGALGTATGKRVFLPGLFFESRAKHPFVAEEKRAIPIDVHYPKAEKDAVTYHLPEGFAVESTPQSGVIPWEKLAQMSIKADPKGSTIDLTRTLVCNFSVLDASVYGGLHDFYQKVATVDQQQIVLIREPREMKGN